MKSAFSQIQDSFKMSHAHLIQELVNEPGCTGIHFRNYIHLVQVYVKLLTVPLAVYLKITQNGALNKKHTVSRGSQKAYCG